MILQALFCLYETLYHRGEISRPGWGPAKISYALCLDEEGHLLQVLPQLKEEQQGNKTVRRPRQVTLPSEVKRTSKILPQFLWDNSAYILGFKKNDMNKTKGNLPIEDRILLCRDHFDACKKLHHKLLDTVDTPAASAILKFFDRWDPENYLSPKLADCMEDLLKGTNLMFRVNGNFAQDDCKIQEAWDRHYNISEGVQMQCLVTGQMDTIDAVHSSIKGVKNAQSSGAALVSFNHDSFCSYGKKQSLNAPVGKYAVFAYTSALNYLLADWENVQHIGDATVVCWAEGAEPQYTDFSKAAFFGGVSSQGLSINDLRSAVKRLADGRPCPELNLNPKRPFYILGLAPNAARISVRFFLRDSFGSIMRHVNEHHERMEIVDSPYPMIPLWALLHETVNSHTSDKTPSPAMAGAVARAIFSGTPYPASLLEAVTLRIRAEQNITSGRAAIIKAYYLKNSNPQCPKEVLQVSLNKNSTNIPYTLGRLFSVYEAVQEKANPGINATIKDKFFNSASATPATIFPILDNLCQKHLRKLDIGMRIYFDRQICDLKDRMSEAYPLRLTLPEQGSFNLGYYHQCKARYTETTPKEE